MNEAKLLKNIDKWRKKEREAQRKLREVSERLALAKASYIVYMNGCPYKVEPDNRFVTSRDMPDIFKEAFNE